MTTYLLDRFDLSRVSEDADLLVCDVHAFDVRTALLRDAPVVRTHAPYFTTRFASDLRVDLEHGRANIDLRVGDVAYVGILNGDKPVRWRRVIVTKMAR